MPLGAPTSFAGTPGLGTVALSWDAEAGATGYRIFRKPQGDPDTSYVLKRDTTEITWTESGVPNVDASGALSWTYAVEAYDASSTGPRSTVNVTMPGMTTANVESVGVLTPKYNAGSGWTGIGVTPTSYGSVATSSADARDSWVTQKNAQSV